MALSFKQKRADVAAEAAIVDLSVIITSSCVAMFCCGCRKSELLKDDNLFSDSGGLSPDLPLGEYIFGHPGAYKVYGKAFERGLLTANAHLSYCNTWFVKKERMKTQC